MVKKIAVIGIDSLDPYILKKYRKHLPNFSKLIEESPTFISKSIFSVDTVPAWSSIYTGLNPDRHGILYVYDVFDPKLSDLRKVDMSTLKGKTFWDYAGKNGLRSVMMYPNLIYPAWGINGVMVSKSPFDRRVGPIETEIDIDVHPKELFEKYCIPKKLKNVWGGFPGKAKLKDWADKATGALEVETNIALKIFKYEKWDLFFVYYSILDIIQHRLWRFFDECDPAHSRNNLSGIILDFYIAFDKIVGQFIETHPEALFVIISDHGHKMRPIKTVNINEHLRTEGFLVTKDRRKLISGKFRKTILEIANKLQVEHWLIKIVSKNKTLVKAGKSIYSSSGIIDSEKSVARLSTFAGIKSYSYGGIEINKRVVSDHEYERLRENLIKSISEIKNNHKDPIVKWVARREEVFSGKYAKKLYPDLILELDDDYGIGWDIQSGIIGVAYDHNVASGGHGKDAVFLMKNIEMQVERTDMNIIDAGPTILTLLGINVERFDFDGKPLFRI